MLCTESRHSRYVRARSRRFKRSARGVSFSAKALDSADLQYTKPAFLEP